MSYLIFFNTNKGKKRVQTADTKEELHKMIEYLEKRLLRGTVTSYIISAI